MATKSERKTAGNNAARGLKRTRRPTHAQRNDPSEPSTAERKSRKKINSERAKKQNKRTRNSR